MKTAVLVVAAILAPMTMAHAQRMSVERERVVGQFGDVNIVNIRVEPLRIGPGVVFTQAIRHPGAETIRLHFRVEEGGSSPFWSVAVVARNRRWEYRPDDGESEFWSDEMPGDNARIELISTMARPPVRLVVDETAGAKRPTVPKSTTDPDQREKNWSRVDDVMKALGRSVVRLRFVDDDKRKVFSCTGWLVFSSRHILTNDHCINTDREMRSALADVDYDEDRQPERSLRFKKLLDHNDRLDFALLELAQPLDRPPLTISLTVPSHKELAIIQHPEGAPKQLSLLGCLVGLASVAGTTDDQTDFEHVCDTLGGSSGSPVIDRQSRAVVGLHHLGYLDGDRPVNRAVLIGQIIDRLKGKFPDIVKAAGIP